MGNRMARAVVTFGVPIFLDGTEPQSADEIGCRSKSASHLIGLISTYKACIAKPNESTIGGLQKEKNARLKIITYEPCDRREALERLSYLFAVVATSNDRLDDDDIKELLALLKIF